MHELSIAQAIVETAAAELEPGAQVLALTLQLGDLSGVYEDSLRFCFDVATEGSPLAGCRLHVERVPATLFCGTCQQLFEPPNRWQMVCPHCQNPSADLRTGRELLIRSLEVA